MKKRKKSFLKVFRLGSSYIAVSDQSFDITVLPVKHKCQMRELFNLRISYLDGRSYIVIRLLFLIYFEIDFYWD